MLFPIGQPLDIKRWGLPWLATHVTSNQASATGQRLAEAVAVAGVRAAGDGRPRTVVLLLSDNPADAGIYGAPEVRDYLRALHVPLAVWSVESGVDGWRMGAGFRHIRRRQADQGFPSADQGNPEAVGGVGRGAPPAERYRTGPRSHWSAARSVITDPAPAA